MLGSHQGSSGVRLRRASSCFPALKTWTQPASFGGAYGMGQHHHPSTSKRASACLAQPEVCMSCLEWMYSKPLGTQRHSCMRHLAASEPCVYRIAFLQRATLTPLSCILFVEQVHVFTSHAIPTHVCNARHEEYTARKTKSNNMAHGSAKNTTSYMHTHACRPCTHAHA